MERFPSRLSLYHKKTPPSAWGNLFVIIHDGRTWGYQSLEAFLHFTRHLIDSSGQPVVLPVHAEHDGDEECREGQGKNPAMDMREEEGKRGSPCQTGE